MVILDKEGNYIASTKNLQYMIDNSGYLGIGAFEGPNNDMIFQISEYDKKMKVGKKVSNKDSKSNLQNNIFICFDNIGSVNVFIEKLEKLKIRLKKLISKEENETKTETKTKQ